MLLAPSWVGNTGGKIGAAAPARDAGLGPVKRALGYTFPPMCRPNARRAAGPRPDGAARGNMTSNAPAWPS